MRYGDNPIAQRNDDLLSRAASVDALHRILVDPQLETPICIGVYGAWGSGKTSVMQMLQSSLPKKDICCWFDAWQYGQQGDALWRALLLALVEQLRVRQTAYKPEQWVEVEQYLDRLVVSLYRSQTYTQRGDARINWKAAAPIAIQAALGFVPGVKETISALKTWLSEDGSAKKLSEIIERDQISTFREHVSSMEQFKATISELVANHVLKAPDGSGRRLFIFVDDLDRCLPEAAVSTLEALKLFLHVPGCVFVLGMDRTVVEQGIRVRYRELAGDGPAVDSKQYLDKIIQIPFTLPALDGDQIKGFIRQWCIDNEQPRIGQLCADIVQGGVAANPRSLKRTLNVLRLVVELRSRVSDEELQYLSKIVVMQTSYDGEYQAVVDDPQHLVALEERGGESRLHRMLAMHPKFGQIEPVGRSALVYSTRVSGG